MKLFANLLVPNWDVYKNEGTLYALISLNRDSHPLDPLLFRFNNNLNSE
jgi:hypothetical protein